MVDDTIQHFYDVVASRYFERDEYLGTSELYEDYVLFCEINGYEPLAHKELSQSWKELDVKIVFKRLSKGLFYKEEFINE